MLDPRALEGVDAVVHLAGENVGDRWNERHKARILRSRVEGTSLLARTLASLAQLRRYTEPTEGIARLAEAERLARAAGDGTLAASALFDYTPRRRTAPAMSAAAAGTVGA